MEVVESGGGGAGGGGAEGGGTSNGGTGGVGGAGAGAGGDGGAGGGEVPVPEGCACNTPSRSGENRAGLLAVAIAVAAYGTRRRTSSRLSRTA